MKQEEQLVLYGKKLHEHGLVIGAGGNISVRDGEYMFIKRKCADMSEAGPEDYVKVGLSSAATDDRLSSETPLHTACYRASADTRAVIHAHSPMMVAAANRTDTLESVSYEFDCLLTLPVPVVDYLRPGSDDLATAVAEHVGNGAKAVLLRRHGAVSVGKGLHEAYLGMLALERACITFLHS